MEMKELLQTKEKFSSLEFKSLYREIRLNELDNDGIKTINNEFGLSLTDKSYKLNEYAEEFLHNIQSLETTKVWKFTIGGYKKFKYEKISIANNRTSKYSDKIIDHVTVYGKNSPYSSEDRINVGTVIINLDSSVKRADGICNILFTNELLLVSINKRINLFSKINDNKYYNWEERNWCESIPENAVILSTLNSDLVTASSKRNSLYNFRALTKEKMIEMYDIETNGAYSLFMESKDLSEIEVLKGMGYLANILTPATNYGVVKNYALYHAKWENLTKDANKEQIEAAKLACSQEEWDNLEAFLKITSADGGTVINVIRLTILIWEKFGILIRPSYLVGKTIQYRPVTMKGAGYITTPEVVASVSKYNAEKYGIGDDKGQYEIVGDENKILFISDMNATKMAYQTKDEFDFYVLAWSKDDSFSPLNKQVFKVVTSCCSDNTVRDNFKKSVIKLQEWQFETNYSEFYPSYNKTNCKIEDLLEDGYIGNLAKNNIEYSLKDNSLLSTVTKQYFNKNTKQLNKIKYGEGIFQNKKLVPDFSFMINGTNTLQYSEAVTNKEEENFGTMVKYPITDNMAAYCFENIIPETDDQCLMDFFYLCGESSLILPASDYLMRQEAGLDFDFDAGAVCFNVEIDKIKNPRDLIKAQIVAITHAADTVAVYIV